MDDQKEKKSTSPKSWRKGLLLVGLSFEIAVLLYFCINLGQKGDRHFGTGAWITAILVLLALVFWFYQLIRLFK